MGRAFTTPIPITLPGFTAGEAGAISSLLDAGAEVVHLRKPGATSGELVSLLSDLQAAGADMNRLTLHAEAPLARRFGCGGIHLRADELPVEGGRDGLRLSASAHSFDEAARLARLVDYVWLSPLFDSISKPGYRAGIDLRDAAAFLASGAVPAERVVALGGISSLTIGRAACAGFGGAALLGALWHLDGGRVDAASTLDNYHRLTRRWRLGAGRLQLISDGDPAVAESFLRAGGRWIQLRMKDAAPDAVALRGGELSSLCASCGAVMLLNDRPQGVRAAGACGVHLGRTDMPPAEARRLLGEGAIIGATANTLDDILALDPETVDYIGLGPYRYTTTKQNLAPLLGVAGYRRIMAEMRARGLTIPVVAIGGIEPTDAPEILAAGVDGLAISGAIAHADDPARATEAFLKALDQAATHCK